MKHFYCRAGGKSNLADYIISLFPKHDIYIEPFFGSGAVYFKKSKSKKEIINDIESELMHAHELLKEDFNLDKIKMFDNLEDLKLFFDSCDLKNLNNEDKLRYYITKYTCGFNSKPVEKIKQIYKVYNQKDKIKNLKLYKERLKNTVIESCDYKEILKLYDSPNSLFYLDPPYEGSERIYDGYSKNIDYNEMSKILLNLKGYFILSINDSKNIRNIFKNFFIIEREIKGRGYRKENKKSDHPGIGRKKRKELIITNFMYL